LIFAPQSVPVALFSSPLARTVLPDCHRRLLVLVFFGCLLGGGLGLVRDYGVSYDEGTQRIFTQVILLRKSQSGSQVMVRAGRPP